MRLLLETVHRSSFSTMYFREFAPSEQLLPYITCFWSGELRTRHPIQYQHRVLPDGCADIIFNLDPKAPNAVLIGPMWRPRPVTSSGTPSLGVRFYPGTIMHFIDHPLVGLQEAVIPLHTFLGASAGQLIDQLMSATNLGLQVAIVEKWLVTRLSRKLRPDGQVIRAIKWIYAERGRIQINEVSRHVGLCERQLNRKIAMWTGYSPKQLVRIMRFQHALETSLTSPQESDAVLAAAHGYSDQSHLIREFQEFGGGTPQALRCAALDIDDKCPIYSIPTRGTLAYHLTS